jgi:hypothetical protein
MPCENVRDFVLDQLSCELKASGPSGIPTFRSTLHVSDAVNDTVMSLSRGYVPPKQLDKGEPTMKL